MIPSTRGRECNVSRSPSSESALGTLAALFPLVRLSSFQAKVWCALARSRPRSFLRRATGNRPDLRASLSGRGLRTRDGAAPARPPGRRLLRAGSRTRGSGTTRVHACAALSGTYRSSLPRLGSHPPKLVRRRPRGWTRSTANVLREPSPTVGLLAPSVVPIDIRQARFEVPWRLAFSSVRPSSARAARLRLGFPRTHASSRRRSRTRSARRSFPSQASQLGNDARPRGLRRVRFEAPSLARAGSDSFSCSESRRWWNPRRRRILRPMRSAEDRKNLAGNHPAARRSCGRC